MKSWGPRREPLPSLNALIALEATARLGSFRAAADEMNVTQGAVAQQIRSVEQELGITLFERLPRGLVPKPEAERLFAVVRQGLSSLSAAVGELQDQTGAAGTTRIILSAPPSFSSRWLIPRLTAFYDRHPNLSIAVDATVDVRPLTGPNRVDLAIRWGETPEAPWHQPILSGPVVVVGAPGYLDPSAIRGPRDLLSKTLISDGYAFWDPWFAHFLGEAPSVSPMKISLSTLAIDAAEEGLGLAISPEPLVRSGLAAGRLVRVLDESFDLQSPLSFHLVASGPPRAKPLGSVARWLIDEANKTS